MALSIQLRTHILSSEVNVPITGIGWPHGGGNESFVYMRLFVASDESTRRAMPAAHPVGSPWFGLSTSKVLKSCVRTCGVKSSDAIVPFDPWQKSFWHVFIDVSTHMST